jgi:uncharacterized NAD(P)/FAD-binding protein YdhS
MSTIVIIGAGFSGTLTAVQLLRRGSGGPLRIVLLERAPEQLARGLAYSTPDPTHLLNVPASRMSALPGAEDHFLRFLQRREAICDGNTYAPRWWYGDYLTELLAEASTEAAPGAVLEQQTGEAVAVELLPAQAGACIHLADGSLLWADRVVLATGHFPPAPPRLADRTFFSSPRYIADPWRPEALAAVPLDQPVLLLGSGLTMVDVLLGLRGRGLRAPAYAVSRHGLLPAVQQPLAPPPACLPPELLKGPLTIRAYWHAVRAYSKALTAHQVDWRDLIAVLRPQLPALWTALDTTERARFLRHARSYWDVHRHRLSPPAADALHRLLAEGGLVVQAGRVRDCCERDGKVAVSVQPRGGRDSRLFTVATVINCTGPSSAVGQLQDPLIQWLHQSGLLSPHPLGLGIEVTDDYALVDSMGNASPVLYYIGPWLQARYWESTAVAELRVHAAWLAGMLSGSLRTADRTVVQGPGRSTGPASPLSTATVPGISCRNHHP